jgi:hypothetical protein
MTSCWISLDMVAAQSPNQIQFQRLCMSSHLMRRLFMLALAVTLMACTTVTPPETPIGIQEGVQEETGPGAQLSRIDSGLVQTATQPLTDLNLIQAKIPPVLNQAQQGPYAPPAELSCAALQTEILALDAALGPDIDATAAPGVDPGLVGQAVSYVGQKAMGTVTSTVNTVVDGVIPFRSWVRKLSGAERHSKAVAAAIAAGTMRRPLLKGWAHALGCVQGPPRTLAEKNKPEKTTP